VSHKPFPIIISSFDHHAWRNWVQAFPFAMVADADDRPIEWFHPDDFKPCKRVAVGLYVTDAFASSQFANVVPLLPDMVRPHIISPQRADSAGGEKP
jgi:hypothetical protein